MLASDHLYFDAILTLLEAIVEGEETEVDRHKLLACVEAVRVEAVRRTLLPDVASLSGRRK